MGGTSKSVKPFIHFPAFFDTHMHIQSGNCTPLPIMWIKIPGLTTLAPGRDSVNALSEGVLGKGGQTFSSSTVEIADKAVKALDDFLELRKEEKILGCYCDFYTGSVFPPLSILFAMTMDMEYAHIAGYGGQTIYHIDREKNQYFYYKRESGVVREDIGEKVYLNQKERKQFEMWFKQIQDTKTSALKHPWRLLPLYHYDPRRWNYWDKEDIISNKRLLVSDTKSLALQPEPSVYAESDLSKGTWNYPFGEIAGRMEKNKPGISVGFKMYTTQGYMPMDERCGCLALFYQKCEKEQIPIVTHCSPGGNTIPEMIFYKEYLLGVRNYSGAENDSDNTQVTTDNREGAEEYFKENFVHPKAWRKVLKKYPQLRICLAHFGGDDWEKGREKSDWIREHMAVMDEYKNVYTDISCFDIAKNRKEFGEFLRSYSSKAYIDRILFGTDWYMILLVLTSLDLKTLSHGAIWAYLTNHGLMKGKEYGTFSIEIKKMLDMIDFRLWIRFTILNPIKFYGLDNQNVLDNLENGMLAELSKKEAKEDLSISSEKERIKGLILEGKKNLKNIQKQIEKLGEIVSK